MHLLRSCPVALLAGALVSIAAPAHAQEATDGSGAEAAVDEEHRNRPVLPEWLDLRAEYRMRTRYINPLDLSGDGVRNTTLTDHRARVHFGLAPNDFVSIHTRIDVLDGVLWGDNGIFRREPAPNSGVSVSTHQPNNTAVVIGLPEGADPLDPDSYVPVLAPADILQIDHVYADIVLPIGLFRSMGGRFLMDIDVGRRVVLTAEVDYASGDNDPRAGSAI
jgi:hypothetical protein